MTTKGRGKRWQHLEKLAQAKAPARAEGNMVVWGHLMRVWDDRVMCSLDRVMCPLPISVDVLSRPAPVTGGAGAGGAGAPDEGCARVDEGDEGDAGARAERAPGVCLHHVQHITRLMNCRATRQVNWAEARDP